MTKRNNIRFNRVHRRSRRAAAAVEFALVAPLFFTLVFGMIEFGRAMMVQQVIVNASREGARAAIIDSSNKTAVVEKMESYLNPSGIDEYDVKYFVNGAEVPDPTGGGSGFGDAVGVEISVDFDEVSWVPLPKYLGEVTLKSQSVMRRETAQ